jgi:hypothetical protein
MLVFTFQNIATFFLKPNFTNFEQQYLLSAKNNILIYFKLHITVVGFMMNLIIYSIIFMCC